jgi:hypothetical protein
MSKHPTAGLVFDLSRDSLRPSHLISIFALSIHLQWSAIKSMKQRLGIPLLPQYPCSVLFLSFEASLSPPIYMIHSWGYRAELRGRLVTHFFYPF